MRTIVITTTMKDTQESGVSAFIMCDADIVQTMKNVIESNGDVASLSTSTYMVGGTLSADQLVNNDLKVWEKRSEQCDIEADIELHGLLAANSTGRLIGAPTVTSGHLASNGGVRGHSAGEFFPFVVMGQGTPENMKWFVIKPNGEKLGKGHVKVATAHKAARMAHGLWSNAA